MNDLPKPHVEMGRADYDALDVETLREAYAELCDIASCLIGREHVIAALKEREPILLVDRIMAIKEAIQAAFLVSLYDQGDTQ